LCAFEAVSEITIIETVTQSGGSDTNARNGWRTFFFFVLLAGKWCKRVLSRWTGQLI